MLFSTNNTATSSCLITPPSWGRFLFINIFGLYYKYFYIAPIKQPWKVCYKNHNFYYLRTN